MTVFVRLSLNHGLVNSAALPRALSKRARMCTRSKLQWRKPLKWCGFAGLFAALCALQQPAVAQAQTQAKTQTQAKLQSQSQLTSLTQPMPASVTPERMKKPVLRSSVGNKTSNIAGSSTTHAANKFASQGIDRGANTDYVKGDKLRGARPNYIYRAKKTDTPRAIAFEFLEHAQSATVRKQFFALNRIAAHQGQKSVAEGQAFTIPVAWMYAKPVTATLLSAVGQVQVSHEQGALQSVNSDTMLGLGEGGVLVTGAQSFAKLALPDGSVVSVEPHSRVVLETLRQYASSDIFNIQIYLNKGRVDSQVKPLTSSASTYFIRSKRLSTGVRGTRFAVSDGDSSQTEAASSHRLGLIEVLEGAVAVASPSKGALPTAQGFGRTIERAEPSEAIALLAQPQWQCAAAEQASSPANTQTTVALLAPELARSMIVDVYQGSLRSIKTALPMERRVLQLPPQATGKAQTVSLDLPEGNYTLAASALDSSGLQGYQSIQTIGVKQYNSNLPAQWVHHAATVSWVWQEDLTLVNKRTLCN